MQRTYWKENVIYQVYPPSFKDSNGDGWGDLRGIISKLDYLQELGVGIVWLGPVYQSPFADNGYDISDYYEVHKDYGTMQDLEDLIAGLHERGIKLIMDLVINHTSDEHPWFQQSRTSKDSPFRDYYIWKPPGPDGKEPNNWRSFSNESAWQWDDQTGEYYLRLFDRKQPDLNWEHAPMREEIYSMIAFWLDKGIDGFRLDAINMISKDPDFPDAPEDARHPRGQEFYKNGPRIHEFLHEMYTRVLAEYPEIMTVGEAPTVTMEQVKEYTSPDRQELNMVLLMELMSIGKTPKDPWGVQPWTLKELKDKIVKWYKGAFSEGWYGVYMSTHDHPRMIPHLFGSGEHREAAAQMIGTFLHTIPGTPFVYQGEELGMSNTHYGSIEDYHDAGTIGFYRREIEKGTDGRKVLEQIHHRSRDGARSPMQWSGEAQGGFSTGKPWIPVNENYNEVNAEQQMQDPDSVFSHYKKLIALRKEFPVMVYGDFRLLLTDHDQLFVYTRSLGDERWLIVINFAHQEISVPWEQLENELQADGFHSERQRLLGGRSGKESLWQPYEACIFRLV
ncbi:alpha-glucosidase [Paenibacillus sp. JX-17]|uniref:Alpha-glucosidase n=1 Tax=Paenibacillus lacisoli TaxID=3064525 RepID=A0ABT9CFW0_9BACL|nr:alpha-glucosidase [Paenibacillus sp. JX-17]MDO7908163.1 alpha-glucosidase [Paenibacillus sp. JX-17]